ncbi:MAG: DUF2799 domain-containing protein [Steroidobacteraceae bacterium]
MGLHVGRGARVLFVLIPAILAGCSSMSAKECTAVDWRAIGYQDGAHGRSAEHFGYYQTACAKHGIRSDFSAYQAGRDEGLHEYCQPANGYRAGVNGDSYGGVCPAPLERGFLASYRRGHELYVLQSRVDAAASRLSAARHERDRIQHEIIGNAAAIVSPESIPEDRAHALVATHQLVERAGQMEAEIPQLERELQRSEDDLQAWRSRFADNQ